MLVVHVSLEVYTKDDEAEALVKAEPVSGPRSGGLSGQLGSRCQQAWVPPADDNFTLKSTLNPDKTSRPFKVIAL